MRRKRRSQRTLAHIVPTLRLTAFVAVQVCPSGERHENRDLLNLATNELIHERIIITTLFTLVISSQAINADAQSTAPQSVVRAVMFWMSGCPHCEEVIENVPPPLREKYGAQFELLMIEVATTQDVDTLYRVAAYYQISREQTGVPFLIIGDDVLVGSDEVRNQLPVLIDHYLTHGGVVRSCCFSNFGVCVL